VADEPPPSFGAWRSDMSMLHQLLLTWKGYRYIAHLRWSKMSRFPCRVCFKM